MSDDYIEVKLPDWGEFQRFALWGFGRVLFSLWFFSLFSIKSTCKAILVIVEMTERGSKHLLSLYNQLPYMAAPQGSLMASAETKSDDEPEQEIITDIMPAFAGKHALIIGDTGTGKSTLAQYLAYHIGGNIRVYDPDAAPDEWQGLEVIGRRGDFSAIASSMEEDLEDLQSRIELRGARGDAALAGMEVITIAEEFPLLKDEVAIAPQWMLQHARRGRKPKKFIILLSQDDNVKTLGIEGEGGVRKCFRMIRLGKFAVTHAKGLRNEAVVNWLKSGNYRCMVDDIPCQLPDMRQFKPVTTGLLAPAVFGGVVTPEIRPQSDFQHLEPPVELGDETLKNAVKVCLSAGFSDSKIIKEILGCQGSRYQRGKELLQQIKGEP